MYYKYKYKDVIYDSFWQLTQHEDFINVSFPNDPNLMTDERLEELGIEKIEYIVPVPSLEVVKENKKRELKSHRDGEENLNVTTEKGEFEFDELSQKRLTYAMNALNNEETRDWTTVDGIVVSMTKADFQEIFNAAIQRSDDNFAKLHRLEAAVDACKTHTEVEAIKWEDATLSSEHSEE